MIGSSWSETLGGRRLPSLLERIEQAERGLGLIQGWGSGRVGALLPAGWGFTLRGGGPRKNRDSGVPGSGGGESGRCGILETVPPHPFPNLSPKLSAKRHTQ